MTGERTRGSAVVRRLGGSSGAVVAGTFASLAWLAGACSSPAAPLGSGSQCLMTTDCMEGLVCVPPPGAAAGASKICSTNLSTTVSTEDAATPMPPDGAAGDGARADGPVADGAMAADAPKSVNDTGTAADTGGGGTADAGDGGGGSSEAGD